jgi:hypothetical protein
VNPYKVIRKLYLDVYILQLAHSTFQVSKLKLVDENKKKEGLKTSLLLEIQPY